MISLRRRSAPREIAAPRCSPLDLGERPFQPLLISLALLIGRCLRLGTGERVQDAQPCQRQEIIESVGHPPEELKASPALPPFDGSAK